LHDSVGDMIERFVTLYSPETAKWDDISDLSASFGWTDMVAQNTLNYLETHGVSKKYAYELVEGATRVNYGQVVFVFTRETNDTERTNRTSMRSMPSRVRAQWPQMEPRVSKGVTSRFSNNSWSTPEQKYTSTQRQVLHIRHFVPWPLIFSPGK
jgi:Prenylcysteine lyase.